MTAAGYTALETELRHCQQVERPRIIQQITDARTHGDLSENAEYHAAKEAQSHNEGRIAELEDKLARAEVIDVTWQWAGMKTPVEQITVASPERYTIRLESSGRLSLQADCNRGGGSYTVTAERQITLGPLSLTRVMCPPGSQSDRFVKEIGRVSSYFTKDGELVLELPVDSGTLRFTRQP